MATGKWTPETPWFGPDKKTQAVWPTYVCRNKNCKSYGKSHPNCQCGAPSFSKQSKNLEYAKGGEVHHCSDGGVHEDSCEHFADGGQIEENLKLELNPSLSSDHAVVSHGLHHLLTKTGHSKSENKDRHAEEYMDHSRRGGKSLSSHMSGMMQKDYKPIDPNHESVESLKRHIDDVQSHPHKMLNISGSLGNNLPDHANEIAAKSANAVDYLHSLKPMKQQLSPLDSPLPTDKSAEENYNRQLEIAEHPLSILRHVKSGTILPQDLKTLHTVYPKLAKEITEKAMESFVDSHSKGVNLPYKEKIGLSALLGIPLDSTMTQPFMAAIIQSQMPKMPQQHEGKGPSKATGVELKQINKVNDLYKDPIEARQINHRS